MKKDLMITTLVTLFTLIYLILSQSDFATANNYLEEGNIQFHGCINSNCTHTIVEELESGDEISCSFYTLKHQRLIQLIEVKDISLVLHEKTNTNIDKKATIRTIENPKLWGLMHNKFCTYTIDGTKRTITGSYNPSGQIEKHDMLILIDSEILHSEYTKEYQEMILGEFAGGKRTSLNELILTYERNQTKYNATISLAFCPEDNCEDRILGVIDSSINNITILAYTFTSELIADAIIEADIRGVEIRIITDRGSRTTQSSQIEYLEEHGIIAYVVPDNLMHHKSIIADNILITGSMNYGKSANTRNDENILIIKDDSRNLIREFISEAQII